jgi:hypothetical protein
MIIALLVFILFVMAVLAFWIVILSLSLFLFSRKRKEKEQALPAEEPDEVPGGSYELGRDL